MKNDADVTAEKVLLQDIFLEAAAREFAQELSNDEPIITTYRFRSQMRSMMDNPPSWAKRRRRPVWMKIMRTAAMIIIACSITMCSIMMASPTARAAITEWVTEWYENSIIYRFFGEPVSEDMPKYKIAELPDGYYETEAPLELPNDIEVDYENENGDVIRFEYMRVEEGSAIVMDTENMEISEIKINNCPGHLYISQDDQQSSFITWYSPQKKIQFVIDGFVEGNELMSMAQSVKKKTEE